jgi:DNA-binding MarR family transcriptional regulator
MKGKSLSELDLDRVIHERSRLRILTYLASAGKGETGFTEIRDELGFTGGNLSVQLRTLEEAGYVRMDKRFVANKSYTGVSITVAGHRALSAYLDELEVIVASLKAGVANDQDETAQGGSHVGSEIIEGDSSLSKGR